LDFERAAALRDKMLALEKQMLETRKKWRAGRTFGAPAFRVLFARFRWPGAAGAWHHA
jgi:hypothetical protein